MTEVTVNGNSYSDAGESSNDMRNGGFRTHLLPMISDTMVEIGAAPALSVAPQGRVTGISGAPALRTGGSTLYYSPYIGDRIPIYGGASDGWALYTFSELTLALDSNTGHANYHAGGNIFDLFVFNDNGTLRLGTGPAWTKANAAVTITIASPGVVSWTAHGLKIGAPVVFATTGALPTGLTAGTVYYVAAGSTLLTDSFTVATSTANALAGTSVNTSGSQSGVQTATAADLTGSVARASGGVSELARLNGLMVNASSITLRWGSSSGNTTVVAANQAIYVGTFYTTSDGTFSFSATPSGSGGGDGIIGYWNAYNRLPIMTSSRDTTTSWTYGTNTWRYANGSAANRVRFVTGLAESDFSSSYDCDAAASASGNAAIGIHADTATGTPARSAMIPTSMAQHAAARYEAVCTLGLVALYAVEISLAGTATFRGSDSSVGVINGAVIHVKTTF